MHNLSLPLKQGEMNKPQEQKEKQSEEQAAKSLVWDCGSSLYDSFELKSFERQLDSAITSRTLSMPRLSADHHQPVAKPQQKPPPHVSKKSSKISRSFHKLLKSVFGSKTNSTALFQVEERPQDRFYVHKNRSHVLTTIPEVPDIDYAYAQFSPEFDSLVRRSASDRFTSTSIGISCA